MTLKRASKYLVRNIMSYSFPHNFAPQTEFQNYCHFEATLTALTALTRKGSVGGICRPEWGRFIDGLNLLELPG